MRPAHYQPEDKWARAMLFSIRYQDHIVRYFSLAVYIGVAIVAFTGVSGIVSVVAALQAMFLGGLVLVFGVAYLIHIRRAWLLGIKDPALKEKAHQAMIAFLADKAGVPQPIRAEVRKTSNEECGTCKL
jgi:hypothetical protein